MKHRRGISSLKAANSNKISQVLLNSRVDGQNWAEVLTVIRWNRGTWMVWMKNHLSGATSGVDMVSVLSLVLL